MQLLAGNADAASAVSALTESDLDGLDSAGIFRAARGLREGGQVPALSSLEKLLDEGELRFVRELAVSATVVGSQSAVECVRAIKELSLDRRLAEVQRRLEKASGNDKLEALLQEKADLLRQKRASPGA